MNHVAFDFPVLSTKPRNALTDELSTCLSELFGSQLNGKAVAAILPCLRTLHNMLQEGASPKKEDIKAFKKGMEDAFLLSSVLKDGDKVRSGLEAVSDVSKLIIGYAGPDSHLQETKYLFMKDALTMKSQSPDADHDSELQEALVFLMDFVKYKGGDGEQVLHTGVIEVKNAMLGHAEKMFQDLQETFQSKLELVSVEVVMPDELETLTSEKITETFLNEHFPMDKTKQISETTVEMARCLKDISVACSFIDVPVMEFLNVQKYELNHRSCLQYLCLWPFKSKHTASFTKFCFLIFVFYFFNRDKGKGEATRSLIRLYDSTPNPSASA